MIDKDTGDFSMDFIFKDWKKLMNKYEADINKELETIRQYKNQILEIKQEVYKQIHKGCLIEDEQRIILSAPEIIIGHVDKSGQLVSESSVITVRGSKINLEGVGTDAVIQSCANKIKQIALDPGPDGKEKVVYNNAEISSLARKITLDSNSAADSLIGKSDSKYGNVYTSDGAESLLPESGISIHSDSSIQVSASIKYDSLKESIKNRLAEIDNAYKEANEIKEEAKKEIDTYVDLMEKVLETDANLKKDNALVNLSVTALDDLHIRLTDISLAYFNSIEQYMKALSTMAESKREKRILEAKQSALNSLPEKQFQEKSTDTKLYLKGEQIDISTTDGDNRLHTSPTSSQIAINAQRVDVKSYTHEESKIDATQFFVNFPTIQMVTHAPLEKDAKEQKADGKIRFAAKNIYVHTADIKKEGDKKEEMPAKGSSIIFYTETVTFPGCDSSGKAVGTVNINGKKVNVMTFNYSKDLKSIDSFAEEGKINLWSKEITMGSNGSSDKQKSEKVQIAAKAINEKGEETISLTQSDNTNIKVEKDKVTIKAKDKVLTGGKITAEEKAKFKEVEADKVTAKNVVASSQLKTPTISK